MTAAAFQPVDFRERVARRKLSLADEWRCFKLEAIGRTRDTLMSFGVPRPLKSGKRKGEMTWAGFRQRNGVYCCCVTNAEYLAERAAWEAETGKCSNCYGRGQELASWDSAKGAAYRPCKTCAETGKAP